MKSLGEQLKQYRIDNNWTQHELAGKLAVSRTTIYNWESGKSFPDLDCLVSLSRLFDVPFENLFSKDTSVVKKITHEQKQNRLKGYLILGLLTVIFS
ncbi:MAG TPA: helix-turn-helix transcriptional regulator [Enterococcus sp.]|nr:helix-turn-helix transcriptional regulator [Enterococcus sp.]